jgi:Eukaryotic membrane protein family
MQIIGVVGIYRLLQYCFESAICMFDIGFYYNAATAFRLLMNTDISVSFSASINALFASNSLRIFHIIVTPALMVFATEILVDWLKHAFITKFNGIKPNVYTAFRNSLCRDLIRDSSYPANGSNEGFGYNSPNFKRRASNLNIDRYPGIAKRIGFVPIPLACLVIRVMIQIFQSIGQVEEEAAEYDNRDDLVGTW